MAAANAEGLSRREAQIMEILHELGQATAAEVQERLPDTPGYSSVRKLLEILEGKKLVRHDTAGRRYVYRPTTSREVAGQSALRRMVRTFFNGSPEQAVAALLAMNDRPLDAEALERITRAAERARDEGR